MPLDKDTLRQINALQAGYANEVRRIQNDPNLSATGKGTAQARLKAEIGRAISRLRDQANTKQQQRRAHLERQVFNLGADYPDSVNAAISFRDAQDRVAEIRTGAEAQQMMRRALRSGDALLQRALFESAWDRAGDRLFNSGWGEVVREYVERARPDLKGAVDELAALKAGDSRTTRMEEQIACSLFTPPELAALNPGDVRAAVADAGSDDVAHLTPGAGVEPTTTVNEAWAKFAAESRDGVYGA